MGISRRTEYQLAILVMGLIVWGYGHRTDNARLTWLGIAFFALAAALRIWKNRDARPDDEHTE